MVTELSRWSRLPFHLSPAAPALLRASCFKQGGVSESGPSDAQRPTPLRTRPRDDGRGVSGRHERTTEPERCFDLQHDCAAPERLRRLRRCAGVLRHAGARKREREEERARELR